MMDCATSILVVSHAVNMSNMEANPHEKVG
jgi:hypothetical protein